jgi:hypothetical protein
MQIVRIILLALAPLTLAAEARAGACVAQSETIKKDDDSTEAIRYLCSANPGNSAPTLRIGFHRLDEALAGTIVTRTPMPEFQTALGPFEIIDNDVSAEARTLFQQYGSQTDYDFAISDVTWNIKLNEMALGGKEGEETADATKPRKSPARPSQVRHIWYLSSSFFSVTSPTLVLREIRNTVVNTTRWPVGYKFSYKSCNEPHFLSCTTIWRYIAASDFDLLLQDMREFIRAGGRTRWRDDSTASKMIPDYERNFQLYRYLAQRGMPQDFLSIYTGIDQGCGGDGWDFTYSGRPLTVDVAIIENLTDQPIRIDDFRGLVSRANGLRVASDSVALSKDAPASLNLPPQTLQPRAKLVLPMRITFGYPTEEEWDLSAAKRTYEEIKSSKRKIFEEEIQLPGNPPKSYFVRKTKESFLEPEIPVRGQYLFGPEISLGGLVADGKEFSLRKSISTNDSDPAIDPAGAGVLSFFVSVGPTGQSCPILFLRSEDSQSWIALGKVLHKANGADKEMTQVIRLPYPQTHFRLTEEEPEISYIKDAILKLTLKDDRHVEVRSRQAYTRIIPAYTSIDMDFDLPPDLSASDIVASEIALTGYYQRYTPAVSLVGNSAGDSRN